MDFFSIWNGLQIFGTRQRGGQENLTEGVKIIVKYNKPHNVGSTQSTNTTSKNGPSAIERLAPGTDIIIIKIFFFQTLAVFIQKNC